jgi:DNA-binding MarR family transcriptional regulator
LGTLSDRITLELAKPIVINHAQKRIHRYNLTINQEVILKTIAQHGPMQVKEIAQLLNKQQSYISNILNRLQECKLVSYTKEWRNHFYYASIDAEIAYS